MLDIVFIYVTFSSEDEAATIGRRALEERLAACVNILPAHRSVYRWNGQIESGLEHIAVFKTSKEREPDLRRWLKSHHSYECPCIASFSPTELNREFADWIRSSVSP